MPDRPPSLSASCTSVLLARRAGKTPNNKAVSIEMPAVKTKTLASHPTGLKRGMPSGRSASSPFMLKATRAAPTAPPARLSTTLSTTNCRMRRPRVAPSAVRTASSRSRSLVRPSRRLATLTQATRSTKPTAPTSKSSAGRMLSVSCDCIDFTVTP
jgi:hypothetical protein